MLDLAETGFDRKRRGGIIAAHPQDAEPGNQQDEHRQTHHVGHDFRETALTALGVHRTSLPAAPPMVAGKASTTASDRFYANGSWSSSRPSRKSVTPATKSDTI